MIQGTFESTSASTQLRSLYDTKACMSSSLPLVFNDSKNHQRQGECEICLQQAGRYSQLRQRTHVKGTSSDSSESNSPRPLRKQTRYSEPGTMELGRSFARKPDPCSALVSIQDGAPHQPRTCCLGPSFSNPQGLWFNGRTGTPYARSQY